MLVFAREVHNLGDLGFGNFITKRPANTDAFLMYVQHDPCRFIYIHLEKAFQDKDDKFHRRIVVVEDQNFIGIGLFGLGPRFGCDANIRIIVIAGTIVISTIAIIISRHKFAQPKGFASLQEERVGIGRYWGENLCFNHVAQDMVF